MPLILLDAISQRNEDFKTVPHGYALSVQYLAFSIGLKSCRRTL